MCKQLDQSLKMEAAGFAGSEKPANHDASPSPSVVWMIETQWIAAYEETWHTLRTVLEDG